MLCFGKDGAMLASLGTQTKLLNNMAEAIQVAHDVSKEGDVVLLAPACASLDQFKSFEERGDIFAKLVLELK